MKLPTSYRAQLGIAADFLLDKNWLLEHYQVRNLTTRQIAKLIGCGKKAVSTALKRHDIAINYQCNRSIEGRHNRFVASVPSIAVGKLNNKDWMTHSYITANKSLKELSQLLGVSTICIRRWLKKFSLTKNADLQLQCSVRRYTESQGFAPSSIAACEKRMKGHRGTRLITIKAGSIWCHSSWERTVAMFLDTDDRVFSFAKDSIKIPYEYAGRRRLYYPDFIIAASNKTIVLEVKAQRLINDGRVRAKLAALREYCDRMNFKGIVLTGTTSVKPAKIFQCDDAFTVLVN